jgi:hypothetical protein
MQPRRADADTSIKIHHTKPRQQSDLDVALGQEWTMKAARLTAPRGLGLVLRGLLVAMLFMLSVGFATTAQAVDTVDCTPMGDPACKDLTAIVECIWNNGNGTYSIAWGYSNLSAKIVRIDIGNKNGMTPGAAAQGQPTVFQIGTFHNVFVTTVTGASMQWRLGNSTYTANSSTPACVTTPVSVVGSVRALTLGIALLFAAGLPLLASRRSRLAVDA